MGRITEKGITEREEAFCKLYATEAEFFCNGVQSYIEAFNVDVTKKGAYVVAKAQASRLLTKPNLLKRIDELVELEGLNDSYVDKQLGKLVQQDADFKVKIQAIKEYNILKARIEKKLKITTPLKDLLNELNG